MSKYLTFSLIIVAFVIGIVGGYGLSAYGDPDSDRMTQVTTESKLSKSNAMDDEMTSYTDQRYVNEMIMHHEDAVTMSANVLKHTSRKEVRTLATEIVETQTAEIVQMKQWLEEWK